MTYKEALINLKTVISKNCINIRYKDSTYELLPTITEISCICRNVENRNKYYTSKIKYTREDASQITTIDCNVQNNFDNLIKPETIQYLTGNNQLSAEIKNDCEFINRLYNFCLQSLCYIEYISDTELINRDISLSPGRPNRTTLYFTHKMGLCYKPILISSSNYNSTESTKNIKVTDITSLLNSIVTNNKNLQLPCNIYYGPVSLSVTNPGWTSN